MVSFKSNSLNRIDEEALTSSITWLILTDNELSSIPRSLHRQADTLEEAYDGREQAHLSAGGNGWLPGAGVASTRSERFDGVTELVTEVAEAVLAGLRRKSTGLGHNHRTWYIPRWLCIVFMFVCMYVQILYQIDYLYDQCTYYYSD